MNHADIEAHHKLPLEIIPSKRKSIKLIELMIMTPLDNKKNFLSFFWS